MAFFGIIAVGVVAGVLSHGDHSDYSEWSEYSDAAQKRRIAAEQKRKQREKARTEYREKANKEFARLEEEYKCKLFNNAQEKFKLSSYDQVQNLEEHLNAKFNEHIHEIIEAEIEKDKKELQEINALISKINRIQLSKKK